MAACGYQEGVQGLGGGCPPTLVFAWVCSRGGSFNFYWALPHPILRRRPPQDPGGSRRLLRRHDVPAVCPAAPPRGAPADGAARAGVGPVHPASPRLPRGRAAADTFLWPPPSFSVPRFPRCWRIFSHKYPSWGLGCESGGESIKNSGGGSPGVMASAPLFFGSVGVRTNPLNLPLPRCLSHSFFDRGLLSVAVPTAALPAHAPLSVRDPPAAPGPVQR